MNVFSIHNMMLRYENVGVLFLIFGRVAALFFGKRRDKLGDCGGLRG